MEDKNMVEEKDILNIENLRVRFETEDGVVYAVNGVNLKLGYKKTISDKEVFATWLNLEKAN